MNNAQLTITRNRLYELIKIQIETGNEHRARAAWGDEQVDRVLKSLGYSDATIAYHRRSAYRRSA